MPGSGLNYCSGEPSGEAGSGESGYLAEDCTTPVAVPATTPCVLTCYTTYNHDTGEEEGEHGWARAMELLRERERRRGRSMELRRMWLLSGAVKCVEV